MAREVSRSESGVTGAGPAAVPPEQVGPSSLGGNGAPAEPADLDGRDRTDTERSGTELNGTERQGMEGNGSYPDGTEPDGSEGPGARRTGVEFDASATAAEEPETEAAQEAEPGPTGKGRRLGGWPRLKTFESLKDQRFRAYFLAMLGAMSSQNMQMVVRGYIAYDLTGSYTALGTISLANALPGILFAVVGGTIADRVPFRRQIVQWCQVVNALASLAICVFAFTGILNFEQLFVTALVQGTSMAIMMPARQALISTLVEPDLLMNAVALNSAGMNTMRLFAPAIGGMLLAWAGVAWVYFLMTALWAIASLYMMRVPEPRRVVDKVGSVGGEIKAGLANMKDGFVYIWQHPIVGPVLGLNVLITITAMPYQFLLAGFVQDVYHGSADVVGYLQSAVGVSALIGALIIASVNWGRRGLMFLLGSALQGVFLLFAFWLASSVLVMGVFLFAMGFGQAIRQSLSQVLAQGYGDEAYRGRIMSIYMLQFSLAQVGAFITGVLAEALGARLALSATSAGLVAISLAGLLLFPKLRRLP